jgi:hypothetical protein
MRDLLTAEQAAGELGYHLNYFYTMLRQGRVKAQQFNRVWMIDRPEVERIKSLQGPGGRLPKEPKQ